MRTDAQPTLDPKMLYLFQAVNALGFSLPWWVTSPLDLPSAPSGKLPGMHHMMQKGAFDACSCIILDRASS